MKNGSSGLDSEFVFTYSAVARVHEFALLKLFVLEIMTKKGFYTDQSSLTAAKIEIYGEYLKRYLPKILMSFGKCLIADLFCGTGKNGSKKGSPLILLETAEYILTSELIKNKRPKIQILFNDKENKNVENLKEEVIGFTNSFF